MFEDNDLFDLYNSLGITTKTEEPPQTEQQTSQTYEPSSYSAPSSNYNPYLNNDTGYVDDYSVTPNYQEQQSYESTTREAPQQTEEKVYVRQMDAPLIKREAPAVTLTKKRQRMYFEGRMKIVASMFVIIVACLLFVSVFNFIKAGQINSTLSQKQTTITELQNSITKLKDTYNLLSDDERVKSEAGDMNFVDSDSSNTEVFNLDEMYVEEAIQDLPSNWFNDVRGFLSGIFG